MNTQEKIGSLKFRVISPDWNDLTEFELIATSEDWQASLRFWNYADFLNNFGNQLKHFPITTDEVAIFELGGEATDKKHKWAYHLLIRVYCHDKAGHITIEIVLNNHGEDSDMQNAQFSIFSEPQQINELGKLLSEWDPKNQSEITWETKV